MDQGLIRQYINKAKKEQDIEALQSAFHLIKGRAVPESTGATSSISPEMYVLCAEEALQLSCLEISAACLKMYFEGNPPANQFLCRAYLCQGQLMSPPATGSVEEFEKAVLCFLKVIEISKDKPRCHFIVYNASVLYLQTVRPLLQPERRLHLVPSLKQVVQSLEEVDVQDHRWRAELMMHLIECLVDSGKMEEAQSFAKVTEEFIKSHVPHLFQKLFGLLVQHNLSESDVLEMSSRFSTLAVTYRIQKFKNRNLEELMEYGLKKEDSEEFVEILNLLTNCTKGSATNLSSHPPQSPTPISPADRVTFLLELAMLALQVKHHKVAVTCLKELKSVREASVGQRIIMECVKCELSLLKKEAKMNDYSKDTVESQLKDIRKLDQCLQSAVRAEDPQAVQAVCAVQWSFSLPLMQHNLKKHIKAPLVRVAQVLEDTQSMFFEMRCQLHTELAMIEEEEGRLQASMTHLQKAMQLDNGAQQRLSSILRLLELRQTLDQTPIRDEDKAAMLIQQARDMQFQNMTDSRPVLVAVGLLLAPDEFQMVLDADNPSESSLGSGVVAQLFAKAQHHFTSVQKMDGHLFRQGNDTNNRERVILWATLVKTARKQNVWDVCRAACRFCLLYDDGRWKTSKTDKSRCCDEERGSECLRGCCLTQNSVKEVLRLLAEIHFINAESIIEMLQTEGLKLNSRALLPLDTGVCVSEEDPHWVVYRDWIQELSAYATSNFLRAAELGVEIGEPWIVENAAVYLWNYNSHLLATREHQLLLPTFQRVVEMLQKTECTGNYALLVLLCNAVARGLIQPLCRPRSADTILTQDKCKSKGEKKVEQRRSSCGGLIDPAALQNVHKASEVSEYALHISDTVHIAVRKQIVATWVQIKRLLQQQIHIKMDTDKCQNEVMSMSMDVLLGLEMLQCNNNPVYNEFKEFLVPSLSTLVQMASACSWTDAVVELQVWSQLAAFCHSAKEYSLLLQCTNNALQLEDTATDSLKNMHYPLYGPTAVNEMLSSAACLRGLSLVHESCGELQSYREGMNALLSSVSYAEQAENPTLSLAAAKHYWNTCLPLTQTVEERRQLKEPLERILKVLVHTTTKHVQGKVKHFQILSTPPMVTSKQSDDGLALIGSIYSLLLSIHTDKKDWKSGLQLLDTAVRQVPHSRHRLSLLKQRILVKAQLGESILMDMEMLNNEGEQCCSDMWHQVALCARNITQLLTCYQKSITTLVSADTQWQKVNLLLEFGAWLYSNNFPKQDAQHQVQWAIDVFLHLETEQAEGTEDESNKKDVMNCASLVGLQGILPQNLSNLREVRCLDSLVRAHTLLAVMAGRTSPQHQLNLLRAYTFVLQIWKVSMSVVRDVFSDMVNSELPQKSSSAASKKDKDKSKSKTAVFVEEKSKHDVLDQPFPSTPKDWAQYICPDQVRQIFRTSSSPFCVNAHSIAKQTQTLFYLNLLTSELHSLSLSHLTLPILHLAETISCDLLGRRCFSDLYRLRIVKTCCQLGMETHSPFYQKLLNISSINEQEQMECRKAIALSQERTCHYMTFNQAAVLDVKVRFQQHNTDVYTQEIWVEKAEVCLSMGLYQAARNLLAEAHLVATELGDHISLARCLLSLAILACDEKKHAQALTLLDKAQELCGDEQFWYQFTLTKVRSVVGQRHHVLQIETDQVIKQGCETLKLVLEQQINRVPEFTFLVMSLEMRGALECIRVIGSQESGEKLSLVDVQRLTAACDTLKECASGFTKLNYREQAAEAHAEYAHGLRILAKYATDRDGKQRFLLDAFYQIQQAVMVQELVVLNVQNLLSPEQNHGLSLVAMRRVLRLRLCLVEFCLDMLEETCNEEKRQALVRETMTSTEIAIEEYTRCTPEPNSTEQEWLSVGSTLGQVVLGQLAALSFHSVDDTQAQAQCLILTGRYLRLLAAQEDPIYFCSLWDRHKQQRRCQTEHLLTAANETLDQAIGLCLQHKLPSSILADASINRLECCGQFDTTVAGQHLALFQSCCSVDVMAEVLSVACVDPSASQLSALLSLQRKLLSQEERPSSMLKGAEDSLNSLSKAFSHLVIKPDHLNILTEIPPNIKILLLQHSKNGSSFMEPSMRRPKVHLRIKRKDCGSMLTCSGVAKISVCPQALLGLREQTRAFGHVAQYALLKESCWPIREHNQEDPEKHQKTTAGEKLTHLFTKIVQDMEQYLHPLLTQLDLSCLRPLASRRKDRAIMLQLFFELGTGQKEGFVSFFPLLVDPSESEEVPKITKARDKQEKGSLVKLPAETGEYVVILADRNLLELPLEALRILQEKGLSSVSRDFSLQLLHSRLLRKGSEKVKRDYNKETKGRKATKDKGDQSQPIKGPNQKSMSSTCPALPSNNFSVDTRDFKYIVPTNECNFEGTSLSEGMKHILETHSQNFAHMLEGFMNNKHTTSLSQMEETLCRCSAFIYMGMERFMANIQPAKLAVLNMSECRMAVLFDLLQKKGSILAQSNPNLHNSVWKLSLEKPLETALLLSLGGVGSIVLNQWHSSPQSNLQTMASVLDSLLRVKQTSGQAVHTLRKEHMSSSEELYKGSHDELFHVDLKEDDVHRTTLTPAAFNCVLYGLPNINVI
ncbi:cilia- and flagella-associated protein 46 [Thalassophryne amazonica]|uniref:cilia- and flagella-associated protein 46 n=1 Tax=Thalassophryne amazonica TaxID=390379 RepID=UPI0014721F7B|nr:cilia- and flagella-associated protein 46 [Thalassophryne amazonica]